MYLNITITKYTHMQAPTHAYTHTHTHTHTEEVVQTPSMKWQKLSGWIKKQESTPIHFLHEPYFKYEDTSSLIGKGKRCVKMTLKMKLESLY